MDFAHEVELDPKTAVGGSVRDVYGEDAATDVDTAQKESLKAIDRPLFRDFWERFIFCHLKADDGECPLAFEVKAFSEALAIKSNGLYEVACEHVHSCYVLLAKVEKFELRDQCFTWINYDKFHELGNEKLWVGHTPLLYDENHPKLFCSMNMDYAVVLALEVNQTLRGTQLLRMANLLIWECDAMETMFNTCGC